MSEKQKTIDRGSHAERLLKDSLLQEALENIKTYCFKGIEGQEAYDEEATKGLYYVLKASRLFENVLKGYIRNGQIASNDISPINIKKIVR